MKPPSVSSKIFSLLKCEFIAPSFILYEFNKHEEECFKKSGLNSKDFELRKKEIISKIKFIDFSFYEENIPEAKKNLEDEDDAPYLALALKLKIPIWSNDSGLKFQDKINVLSTKDIIELFFD